MVIRTLEPGDAELAHTLRLLGLRESPEAFGSTYEDEVDLPEERKVARCRPTVDRFSLGAFSDDGTLVGLISFVRSTGRKDAHKGGIAGMYVDPTARRGGVGRALMEETVRRARELPGLEAINLQVTVGNEPAIALYRALGFEAYGIEPRAHKFDGQYRDEMSMQLWLA